MDLADLYRQTLLERFSQIASDWRGLVDTAKQDPRLAQELPAAAAYLFYWHRQVFWPCLQTMLSQSAPFLENRWPAESQWLKTGPALAPLIQTLDEYEQQQVLSLEVLQTLDLSQWNRTGRHRRWGVRTVQWWVEEFVALAETRLGLLLPEYNLEEAP